MSEQEYDGVYSEPPPVCEGDKLVLDCMDKYDAISETGKRALEAMQRTSDDALQAIHALGPDALRVMDSISISRLGEVPKDELYVDRHNEAVALIRGGLTILPDTDELNKGYFPGALAVVTTTKL